MNKQEWLEVRRNCLGASDCAAVLGQNPYSGQLAVYASKVYGDTEEENDAMWLGHRMEGVISDMFTRRTGIELFDPGDYAIKYSREYPWIGATLDRATVDGTPVELKNVGSPKIKSDEWETAPPIHYQIQLQMQMLCMDATRGYLVGLFYGRDLKIFEAERNDDFLRASIPILSKFWHENVLAKSPPPADVLPSTLDVVKRVWPEENGEIIELGEHIQDAFNGWEDLKTKINELTKEKKELEVTIRSAMKSASFGEFSDGTRIALKTVHVNRAAQAAKQSNYRLLQRVKG